MDRGARQATVSGVTKRWSAEAKVFLLGAGCLAWSPWGEAEALPGFVEQAEVQCLEGTRTGPQPKKAKPQTGLGD